MDLYILLSYLLKHKYVLIVTPIFIFGIAVYLTEDLPKKYKSEAHLSTGFTIGAQVSITDERVNMFEADSKFNNLIQSLQSRKVFNVLSYELLLHELKNKNNPYTILKENQFENYSMILRRIESGTNLTDLLLNKINNIEMLNLYDSTDLLIDRMLEIYMYRYEDLKSKIQFSRIGRTDYVAIIAYTHNAELSAFLVNKICEIYTKVSQSEQDARYNSTIISLQKNVDEKKADLDEKSNNLRYFKRSNNYLNYNAESSSLISQIKVYENELDDEQRKLRSIQLELAELRRKLDDFNNDPSQNQSNRKIIDLRNQIEILNQRYIESNFENTLILDSLSVLRTQLNSLIEGSKSIGRDSNLKEIFDREEDLEMQEKITQSNIESIKETIALIRNSAESFASKEAVISNLESEVNLATQEYLQAQERLINATDKISIANNSIQQVLNGQPSVDPEPTQRLQIVIFATAASFFICLIGIIVVEFLDVSIKTPANLKQHTNLKLLGTLNNIKSLKQADLKLFQNNKIRKKEEMLFIEQLRKIRFEIDRSSKKVFLVTSHNRKDGKSTFIYSIAILLSKIGKRTLIIDTNFYDNQLTKMFKVESEGLQSITKGKNNIRMNISKNISETVFPNLFIIGTKEGNYSPSEIFKGNFDFWQIIKTEFDFDYIFYEGPALNEYSGTKELIEVAEKIILVYSATSKFKVNDQETSIYLHNYDRQIIGAILNKVSPDNANII